MHYAHFDEFNARNWDKRGDRCARDAYCRNCRKHVYAERKRRNVVHLRQEKEALQGDIDDLRQRRKTLRETIRQEETQLKEIRQLFDSPEIWRS